MSAEDRCFCGEAWNDVAEECFGGHAFGQEDRLRVALRTVISELTHRCAECDQPAFWVEALHSGHEKWWCDEHVSIVQKAISKGASRYQPQRRRKPHWLEVAERALLPISETKEP